MLDQQLTGANYFCGQVITGYDLQIYCELNSIKIFGDEQLQESFKQFPALLEWTKRIDIIPEVSQVEQDFQIKARKLIEDGMPTVQR